MSEHDDGMSWEDPTRPAAEMPRRQRFADLVGSKMDELKQDPEAWRAYLAEEDSTRVRDGLD